MPTVLTAVSIFYKIRRETRLFRLEINSKNQLLLTVIRVTDKNKTEWWNFKYRSLMLNTCNMLPHRHGGPYLWRVWKREQLPCIRFVTSAIRRGEIRYLSRPVNRSYDIDSGEASFPFRAFYYPMLQKRKQSSCMFVAWEWIWRYFTPNSYG